MTISNPFPTLGPIITTLPNSVLFSRTVAVIGAGDAGLSAALELRREGHKVTVYEQKTHLRGTWSYTPETESDPIGSDPTRKTIQSSLYASLRTNLPREVMGFRDYPFVENGKPSRDPRKFPGHGEVMEYLKDYADNFGLCEFVRFRFEVEFVGLVDKKRVVRLRNGSGVEVLMLLLFEMGFIRSHGLRKYPFDERPGKQIHSHNYRVPEPFRNQLGRSADWQCCKC